MASAEGDFQKRNRRLVEEWLVRRLRCFSQELAGVRGRFAGVFVLQVDVDIGSIRQPRVDALPPGFQLLRRVLFEAQARVGKRRGDDVRRGLLFGFGEAERRLVLTQYLVGSFGVPGGVAHLERETERGWPKRKEIFEQRAIEFEVGRELDEDGSEMVAVV